jgi:deoxyribonuclease-4
MLIGAHVSTSGGPARALDRGAELGAEAIQIFNQSPRMWRPTQYAEADLAAVAPRLAEGPVRSLVIHAVYLINIAAPEPEIREKSLTSLVHALRVGDAVGADGVVLHPGSAKRDPLPEAMARVIEGLRHALDESERCPLLLENTAGAGATIGRTFGELAELLAGVGADGRMGVCLDCCHLLASGYDVRTVDGVSAVVDGFEAEVGLDRLRCLHVNDSKAALGTNRDQHERLGDGELGRKGLGAFLSEPRFDGLPSLLEGPGRDGKATLAADVELARELRSEGLAARR